jgi:hypothetical protein
MNGPSWRTAKLPGPIGQKETRKCWSKCSREASGLSAYEDRLREVGLTILEERRRRGDMITMFRVLSEKDRVDSTLWFDMANQRQREGVTSTS